METYKKPVVASKNEYSSSIVTGAPALLALRKLFGDDDFHKEKSLTPRKKTID